MSGLRGGKLRLRGSILGLGSEKFGLGGPLANLRGRTFGLDALKKKGRRASTGRGGPLRGTSPPH